MKVDVRPGQVWEFTDRAGRARRARVVSVSDPVLGPAIRHVFLRRVGSGAPMRSTLHRLERQIQGARLVEDCDGPEPSEPKPNREAPTKDQPPPRRETLYQPTMSAAERRKAIATAQALRARGRPLVEIAKTLSVLPEIVESWLSNPPASP